MARSLALALPLLVTLVTATATAQPDDSADTLRARDDRIADLERKLETVVDELADLREQVAVPAEPELKSIYGLGPAASKIYGIERGLSIGGYGEGNYRNFIGDESDADLDRADFHRLVLYFGYKFSERIVFNSEIEFEHGTTSDVGNGAGEGSVSVEFAALDFLLHPKLNARAGMLLLPMGFLNEVHEPPFYYGVSRPETEQRIIPSTWRENGVGIFGNLTESLEYRAYLVTGFNASEFSDAGIRGGRQNGNRALAEDLAFVVRSDWRPDAAPGLLLGGSFYFGDSGQDLEIGGMDVPDSRLWIGEAHAQYRRGPLHLRALAAYSRLDDAQELNLVLGRASDRPIAEAMFGAYGEVAYDVWPLLADGAHGWRLEPFARVEYVDTQFDVPSGFTENERNSYWVYTTGINYYPHPNVVLKLEYRNLNARGGTRPDELAVGIGFAF